MALALAKSAPLKPEIRLAQAVSEFEADLSVEQKDAFRDGRSKSYKSAPDAHDVMRVTAEFDRCPSHARLRCFGTRLMKFLNFVQQFAAAGDVIVGASQSLIACGVWTAVRLTLVSGFQQLASSLWDSDTGPYEADLNNWAKLIKQEAMTLGLRDQRSGLKILSIISNSEAERRRREAKLRVLNACSKYDHQTTWKEIRKGGNTTLFDQMPEYGHWKTREESCTLVCKGRLGSGKSVWLANILDDLNLHIHSARRPVAYFFCRHDISESLNAHTVISCLTRQLLGEVSDLTEAEKSLDATTPTLDFDKLLWLLKCALPSDAKPFFVLDGLDECEDGQRSQLIEKLVILQNNFALHICVSFRVEADDVVRLNLGLFANHSIMEIPKANPDINGFITAQLGSCLDSGRLAIGNPALILEIHDALLQGAQGMFLWVALQIESLCDAKTDEALRQALADLPRDLPETYSRVLRRSGERGKDYQRRALELITVARRPLTTEELREALSVVPGDATWNSAGLLNDVYSALACCGGLITVDEEELTVRLVHHSVKQFLLGEFEGSAGAIFTWETAERTMGNIVVTYLNYGVFETQVSRTAIPQMAADKVISKVMDSAIPSSRTRNLARVLLRASRQPDMDLGKAVFDARSKFSLPSVEEFRFYAYAKPHWLPLAWRVSEQPSSLPALSLRLLKREIDEETLLHMAATEGCEPVIKLLVNNSTDSEVKLSGQRSLFWAVQEGHEVVVRLLLDRGAELASRDHHGQMPLLLASEMGHEAIVRLLLDRGAELESRDFYNRTPLLLVAKTGHEAVVWLLLVRGAELESRDHHSRTPLSWAAEMGYEPVVRLLLDRCAELESRDFIGQTPLSRAAEMGHEAVVRLLLDRGAELESRDYLSRTPLYRAAAMGHKAVVRLLLDRGANRETRDKSGATPRSIAVKRGNIDAAILL
ncbi:Uncharacterized protein TPAR_04422 [Tolypocladium paradoxum]|uniref:Uncharacterized protein n=1 Tax=Tolypocladium paradoxum TaxID=94208 RepID=A0A2S4KYZ3_9HYPO|nr:Uncharacterized protein TPAR_04422 [Tolypocladium paradoxum]